MTTVRFDEIAALTALVRPEFGPWSPAVTVGQPMIDAFAEMTGDRQWIHVDTARAARDSPFGATIAHGFLLLALAPMLKKTPDLDIGGHGNALNYGLDRVRFLAPVTAGTALHGQTRIAAVEARPDGTMVTLNVAIHAVGNERPAVVFDWKILYRPQEQAA